MRSTSKCLGIDGYEHEEFLAWDPSQIITFPAF